MQPVENAQRSERTRTPSIPESQVFRVHLRASATNPAHAASVLADARQQCSYPDVPAHLDRIQQFLTHAGVRAGDCVVLEVSNSLRAALTILAVLDGGYSAMLTPVQGQSARAAGSEIQAPKFARWLVVETPNAASGKFDLTVPSTFLQVQANPVYDSAAPAPAPASPRIYLKTSGSLGASKLAVHDYPRLFGNCECAREHLQFGPADRIALPAPIFHMFALSTAFVPAFVAGSSLDFQERANLLRFLEREEDFNPNIAFFTPTFCETLLRARKAPRPYRFIGVGGDCTSESTRMRSEAMHGPLLNCYGSTEMGIIAMGATSMPPELRSGTAGVTPPGVKVRYVGSANTAEGSEPVGELQVQHPYGFEGYVDLAGQPMQPPGAFDDGWYCTRDLAKPGPQGTVQILGRSDLSVNRNGLLLPFADVELKLRELEGVEEAAVAAGPEGIRGRALIAFCVLARGAQMSDKELRARYAEKVPAFAVPDSVRIIEALPKLWNGKIDRRALAAMAG